MFDNPHRHPNPDVDRGLELLKTLTNHTEWRAVMDAHKDLIATFNALSLELARSPLSAFIGAVMIGDAMFLQGFLLGRAAGQSSDPTDVDWSGGQPLGAAPEGGPPK